MISLSMLFTLMMLPGVGLLAVSLIVAYFEGKQTNLLNDKSSMMTGCD
ncbi:hypothetical protein SG34_025315 [Thalassomonas viridans]|uniref:Uncharacterized protein n=1 Tax=Thalassomonas viridans TaxID=137584 RepID=A0AAE9Z3L0_9GAMM|nr:hypothetical protein [Thalassomonas viridans]WDE04613.1 hypothetical protein SG34_025315 [Thalassomonas viridans]